ncbi:MAG: hypothetical protein M0018_07310 [Nitrospiraceae bacterium]|nr:hypothetical protein [Nitrospiraceae bacterium]
MDSPLDLMPGILELRKPKNKREKIEEAKRDMARVLLESGRSYREVAGALEISIGSVHNIIKEPHEKTAPLLREIRERSAAKNLLLADHFLNRITDYNVNDASLKDKVICAAILTDKAMQMARKQKAGESRADETCRIEQIER